MKKKIRSGRPRRSIKVVNFRPEWFYIGGRGDSGRRLLILLVWVAVWLTGWQPGPVRGEETAEMIRLIDSPTAGLIDKGRFGFDLRMFSGGGLMGQLNAGVLKRLMIGVSYGGEQIIGDLEIDWYPRLEATARYRIIEESEAWPALVIGYETQGYGAFSAGRYQVKSKGIFLSLSKNYTSGLGQFGVHAGANLTREDGDGDDDPSGWVGVDKSINEDLVLVGEYDLGLNDDAGAGLGSEEGYLNAGLRWAVAPQLKIGFYLKNLLGNGDGDPEVSRELSVLYFEEF